MNPNKKNIIKKSIIILFILMISALLVAALIAGGSVYKICYRLAIFRYKNNFRLISGGNLFLVNY